METMQTKWLAVVITIAAKHESPSASAREFVIACMTAAIAGARSANLPDAQIENILDTLLAPRESRAGLKTEAQIVSLKQRVLAKVRELSLLGNDVNGNSQLKNKTTLKAIVGGNNKQLGIAIDELLHEAKLVKREEDVVHPETKRLTKRKVIDLPQDGFVAAPVEQPMEDVAVTLAGIVDGRKC